MKMVNEHLGEIIIALVIFAVLVAAVWAIKGPMDGFFVNIAESLTQPSEPDIDNSGGGEVTEPETVPPYTYVVKYNSNGGTGMMDPSNFPSGEVVNLPAHTFVRTGYTFSGWALSDSGSVVWADQAAVKDLGTADEPEVELYAVWRANTYQVEFNANGGAGTMEKQQHTYDAEQNLTENTFTKDGYTFKGWNTKADGSGTSYADKASVKNLSTGDDVKLYAQWEKTEYKLEYVLTGGTLPSGSKTSYSTEDETFTLPTPVKDGYIFIGWTGSNGANPQVTVTVPKGSSGDKAYTANWIISMYDITYHVNDGKMPDNVTRSYTIADAVLLPVPTRDGYTFGGWYTNENLTGTAVTQIAKGSTGNKEFWAKWTANEVGYTVKHWLQKLGAGTEKNEDNYFVHNTQNLTGSVGTSITPSVQNITGFTAPAAETVTIAANGSTVVNYYYLRNSYKFTLGSADGVTTTGSSATGTYQYGATIILKGAADAGYTWSKWTSGGSSLVADKTECETTFTMPAGAVTMTPVATLNSYNITYHLNGGTQGSNATTKYDVTTSVTLPTPTKDGYGFVGWYTNSTFSGAAVKQITKGSTGDKEFWAKWMDIPVLAANSTWYSQGGTNIKRSQVTSIAIVDTYDITGKTIVDQWDASTLSTGANDNEGPVTAYLENDGNGGYKLTIAGNGYGRIFANPDSSYAFSDAAKKDRFTKVTAINGGTWLDTSKATDMSCMFQLSSLKSLDVSNWDTSNVTTMKSMFDRASSLTSIAVKNWKTGNVIDMSNMFQGCISLSSLDLSNWDVSKVTSMSHMFADCVKMERYNFSGWNMASLENLSGMFNDNSALTSIDVSDFDTAQVVDMAQLFEGCINLKSIKGLESWDTSNNQSLQETFSGCGSLTELNLSAWDTSSVKILFHMFNGCSSLKTISVSNKWSTESLLDGVWPSSSGSNYAGKSKQEKVFFNCGMLVGGNRTAYADNHVDYDNAPVDSVYAQIDGKDGKPGYLTSK